MLWRINNAGVYGVWFLHIWESWDCNPLTAGISRWAKDRLQWLLIKFSAKAIAEGLSYLHSKGIAHRDLKPGNILVCNREFNRIFPTLSDAEKAKLWKEKPCEIKLTDFGTAWWKISQDSKMIKTQSMSLKVWLPYFPRGGGGGYIGWQACVAWHEWVSAYVSWNWTLWAL